MGKIKQIDRQFELVSAIKANSELVLKKIYQDNYKKVEIHILQNSGSIAEAKDVYQEAFIAMWQNVKKDKFIPRNDTALQGYLFQIAKNKWIDVLRSSQFKKTASLTNRFDKVEGEIDELREAQEENDLKLISTMTAFRDLGSECKDLLRRFYFEKSSLIDIANNLGLAEASARNKKYRCIQQLRKIALNLNPQ